MTVRAYARATSCAQGDTLSFVVSGTAPVEVADVASDRVVFTGVATPAWELEIGAGWPSSLYRARFGPEVPWPQGLPGEAPCPDNEVFFVVREAVPAAPILVSVPFATWQAYNRAGEPGQGLYWTESPVRAGRVSFDRPGGGPSPERWEFGLIRWLRPAGYEVAYCSNLDLDDGRDLLARHRVLVVNGHDEYWSDGMRDAVEGFVRRGGNLAVLSGNTAWWRIRLEDGGRTMVCHRDALCDLVDDPRLATVEWSSAGRPENTLTGVSFRAGAGTWGPHMRRMLDESYTARFADHWVFQGTGLKDGDPFGQGCLGYETDAAEVEEIGGVPRATCRDGTPPSFVVLATADLRHWSAYGQGGTATMGIFTSGLGTVFNAATVNWGNTLHDPVVERVTRNVLDRFSGAAPAPDWEIIGAAGTDVRALAVLGRTLYAVDGSGALLRRELCGQNLPWEPAGSARTATGTTGAERIGPGTAVADAIGPRTGIAGTEAIGPGTGAARAETRTAEAGARTGAAGTAGAARVAGDVVALAVPREAAAGFPVGLYGLTDAGRLVRWDGEDLWADLGAAPSGVTGLAVADCTFYAVTGGGELWRRPFASRGWEPAGVIRPADTPEPTSTREAAEPGGPADVTGMRARRVSGLAAMNGRLFAGLADGRVLTSLPGGPWEEYDVTLVAAVFTAHAGALVAADRETPLSRHTVRRRHHWDSGRRRDATVAGQPPSPDSPAAPAQPA
ncbi:N,N-dimethylformamidase beta subunit family domain-containing protein [Nonomuraea sp. NPDC050691]|uniref:N,N-dimethylformamidase beta subunit family domain-containing protein n=1 Tax=Nonomuraea sp. NPDC050691 TaxID=3155661 RepID=UPI0033DF7C1E